MSKPHIPPPSAPAAAVSSLIKIRQEERAEDYRRAVSVHLWTKVAAIAAIIGAVAAIAAAVLALLAWRFPIQG